MPKDGSTNYASAGLGAPPSGGSYTYKAQCVFFQSGNKDCCATKAGWSTAIGLDYLAGSADACSGTPADNWKDKMRTWRLETRGYTPSKSWPIERAAGEQPAAARAMHGRLHVGHGLYRHRVAASGLQLSV